jgi:hypothetical protein
MTFSIERAGRPVFGSRVQAPDRQASQGASFQAALQRAASSPPASQPTDEPQTEAQLIDRLHRDMVTDYQPEADELQGAMVLDQVKPFLDRQPPEQRQATVLRLLEAFETPEGHIPGEEAATYYNIRQRYAWVRDGIGYAATLSGLATDPAEAQRREGEEAFASTLHDRGNTLEYHPDETQDSPEAMAADIRTFLDETTRGTDGKYVSDQKWTVLNRLYERDWVDAGPVMGAIEQVAAQDFGRELLPTMHRGAGTHAAANAISNRAGIMGGNPEWEAVGIANPQFYSLAIGARHASSAAQLELANTLSGERFPFTDVTQFITMPLLDERNSLQENGLEMFRRLEWMTRDMEGPLAAQVVGKTLDEMQSTGGLPDKIDFNNWQADGESWEGSALANLNAVATRIKGTADGVAVLARLREFGMIRD